MLDEEKQAQEISTVQSISAFSPTHLEFTFYHCFCYLVMTIKNLTEF